MGATRNAIQGTNGIWAFFFTLGQHCLEVPYDPDLYFLGEELVMMARSFTHGYDMFHPHRVVVGTNMSAKDVPRFGTTARRYTMSVTRSVGNGCLN